MTIIRQEDFIQSIADALQYIACFHSPDFIQAMAQAYQQEASPAAKDAIAQILTNSRLCAIGKRPICQDTGIVVVLVQIGMSVQWDTDLSLQTMVDIGVRRAYLHPENVLRASIVADPAGKRSNTRDNTPAVVHVELVPGHTVHVQIAAKGGGSENKARLGMLNPGDNLAEWVLKQVADMGAGWCPPGVLGIGIGGSAEKAMLLAKQALFAPIDLPQIKQRGASNAIEQLRLDLHAGINALGIGAQGLGGLTTVLDVKILDYPTHAASLPVALIPNCAATRHTHFQLDGNEPAEFQVPDIADWPDITWMPAVDARRVNLDSLTRQEMADWQVGETLLLSGTLLTGRDAAHRRLQHLIQSGNNIPENIDFNGKFIYYVGPVDAVKDEVVGPAGPTTATRMDPYTDTMLGLGLLGMIGKAERGTDTIASLAQHQATYLIAVGGAAYLVSQAIRKARVLAFADLGMEAIYEMQVKDMPVTVAVNTRGDSIHQQGPQQWARLVMPVSKE